MGTPFTCFRRMPPLRMYKWSSMYVSTSWNRSRLSHRVVDVCISGTCLAQPFSLIRRCTSPCCMPVAAATWAVSWIHASSAASRHPPIREECSRASYIVVKSYVAHGTAASSDAFALNSCTNSSMSSMIQYLVGSPRARASISLARRDLKMCWKTCTNTDATSVRAFFGGPSSLDLLSPLVELSCFLEVPAIHLNCAFLAFHAPYKYGSLAWCGIPRASLKSRMAAKIVAGS